MPRLSCCQMLARSICLCQSAAPCRVCTECLIPPCSSSICGWRGDTGGVHQAVHHAHFVPSVTDSHNGGRVSVSSCVLKSDHDSACLDYLYLGVFCGLPQELHLYKDFCLWIMKMVSIWTKSWTWFYKSLETKSMICIMNIAWMMAEFRIKTQSLLAPANNYKVPNCLQQR